MMRVGRKAFSLIEALVTLALALAVLTVVGVHMHQLTRLSLTPLDQGWEALQLSLRSLGQESAGAYQLTLGPATVSGRQAGIAQKPRLDAPGPSWSYYLMPVSFRYTLASGYLVRQALSAGGTVLSESRQCPADFFEVRARPNGFEAELGLARQRVIRQVYRWVR